MNTQEIERGFQEIWKLFAETDRKFKETDKRIGDITGKWSRFVEGLVAPAAERLFQERGIHVERVYQRVKAHKNGAGLEVDILAVNEEYAVLIEAKSTLGVDDVRDHRDRLKTFKMFFPEYADRKVVGAVAGIVIEEEADTCAYRQGFFVIAQSGEIVTILNDETFQPTLY